MSSASSSPDSFNSSKRLRCDGCGEAEKAQQTFFTRRNSTRWPVLAFALVWSPRLVMMVRSVAPCRMRAASRFWGSPGGPKPPTMMLAPSGMSATASSNVANTLFFMPCLHFKDVGTFLPKR